MIEALGVPHTEVELVLVNGESVTFERCLLPIDRVAVYSRFEALDVAPEMRVREHPLRDTRFVADAHLGGLARLLRMAGFDTVYDNHFQDGEIAAIAVAENRIVLSRDRELLKRKEITHGFYLHALKSDAPLREIIQRLDLAHCVHPFTRCLLCNAPLQELDTAQALPQEPAGVRRQHAHLRACEKCQRVYWEGAHWQRMNQRLSQALSLPG